MIVVTGMHRSGMRCITGILNICGYSLGTVIASEDNNLSGNEKECCEKIHIQNINNTILRWAGGSWCAVPSDREIIRKGMKVAQEIQKFSELFNGDIFRDPCTCLTISLWERFCSSLDAVILCLRNPIDVATSLHHHTGVPFETGMRLWYEYNIRFLHNASDDIPVIVVNYDNFRHNLIFEITNLLFELNTPSSIEDIGAQISAFYNKDLNHDFTTKELFKKLPKEIRKLYDLLLTQTFSYRTPSIV